MIKLRIITPRKIVFEEDVKSVTAPATEGEITVLPRHTNLFTTLKEGIVTIRMTNKEDFLSIGGGFLETDGKEINLLVSHAYGQQEVDEKLTEKALKDAERLTREAKSEEERHEAAALLRRSVVDLKLLRKHKRRVA